MAGRVPCLRTTGAMVPGSGRTFDAAPHTSPRSPAPLASRSRLVSYAAIMHGCSLLSALPAITHEMAQRLDAADETVSEEILRTVGNLARYALSAQSTPRSSMAKALSWQRPSSAPVPPQGAPGSSGQLGTPRKRPAHWAPSHCLGCSS